jgi:two-component system, OmpR family, response regulator ChvI
MYNHSLNISIPLKQSFIKGMVITIWREVGYSFLNEGKEPLEKNFGRGDALFPSSIDGDKEISNPLEIKEYGYQDDIIFQGVSSDFCVCMVDIVNSTVITTSLSREDKIRKFYSLFVNSVSPIIAHFGGKILKTGGDSVIYYFADTSELKNIRAFRNVLDCGLSILDLRGIVNSLYEKEAIPPISYRVSADYGRSELAKSRFSPDQDFFGPTMNLCAKINNKAAPNSMVIGGDFHQVIKKLHSLERYFQFHEISEFSVGLKQRYPIYLVLPVDSGHRLAYEALKDMILHQQFIRRQSEQVLNRTLTSMKELPSELRLNDVKAGGHIMLVDDQPDMLFTYRSFLEGQGFNVHSFTDPTVALRQFAKEDSPKFDLVVMDIRMPHLNGLQLYQRLKAINSHVRILFVTALDAAEELVSLLPDVGSNQVIMKPVSRDRFLNCVKLAVHDRA